MKSAVTAANRRNFS